MKFHASIAASLFALCAAIANGAPSRSDEPLVDLAKVDPAIRIELRYATPRNVLGRAIYPAGTRCLVRQSVAERLRFAQYILRKQGFGLKIWDAYRPPEAQRALWEFHRDTMFVANPERQQALHTWGVAVDATLVTAKGRDVPMPTDFDDFSDAARLHYAGADKTVAGNLRLLQGAMRSAGFFGLRVEWWHFIAKDWALFAPVDAPAKAAAASAKTARKDS